SPLPHASTLVTYTTLFRSVPEAGRAGIVKLRQAQEEKSAQGVFERHPEALRAVPAPSGHQERHIRDPDQRVLPEVHIHIIAQVFADQVLKEQPSEKEIDAPTPIPNGFS